jgi:hypothetical protein
VRCDVRRDSSEAEDGEDLAHCQVRRAWASHRTDFVSVLAAILPPLIDQLMSPLREDHDPQAGSLAENVHDRKDDHHRRRSEARATRRGPQHGAWRTVAVAAVGHRGACGPAQGPNHRCENRP